MALSRSDISKPVEFQKDFDGFIGPVKYWQWQLMAKVETADIHFGVSPIRLQIPAMPHE